MYVGDEPRAKRAVSIAAGAAAIGAKIFGVMAITCVNWPLQWGRIDVQVPQANCRCGRYIHLKFQTLRLRKQIWDDLSLESRPSTGLSNPQIKIDSDRPLHSSFGLRSLNQQVISLGSAEGAFPLLRQGEVPPFACGWDLDHP